MVEFGHRITPSIEYAAPMVAAALRLFFSVADILTLPCDAKPCHGGKERSMAQGLLIGD